MSDRNETDQNDIAIDEDELKYCGMLWGMLMFAVAIAVGTVGGIAAYTLVEWMN